jgi:hypothetical protein
MGSGEWFEPIERTPDAHVPAGEKQFPRHHQAIAPVVTRPHQHDHGPLRLQEENPAAEPQGRLLHQGLHGQAAGEEFVLDRSHLGSGNQQVVGIPSRPVRRSSQRGHNSQVGAIP